MMRGEEMVYTDDTVEAVSTNCYEGDCFLCAGTCKDTRDREYRCEHTCHADEGFPVLPINGPPPMHILYGLIPQRHDGMDQS